MSVWHNMYSIIPLWIDVWMYVFITIVYAQKLSALLISRKVRELCSSVQFEFCTMSMKLNFLF